MSKNQNNVLESFQSSLSTRESTSKRKPATPLKASVSQDVLNSAIEFMVAEINNAESLGNNEAILNGSAIGMLLDIDSHVTDERSSTFYASRLNTTPLLSGVKFTVADYEAGKKYKSISGLTFKLSASGNREMLQRAIGRSVSTEVVEAWENTEPEAAFADILSRQVEQGETKAITKANRQALRVLKKQVKLVQGISA